MIEIKIWAMTYGVVIFGWLAFLSGLVFCVLAIWEKGRSAKLTAGLFLICVATIIFMFLSAPANWVVLSNIGGL